MSAAQRNITPADILPVAEYNAKRGELRAASITQKKNRRIEIGDRIPGNGSNFPAPSQCLSQFNPGFRMARFGRLP